MVCRVMLFEMKDYEKAFFEKNKLDNFNITFIEKPLNKDIINSIPKEQLDNVSVISVYSESDLCSEVINSFKNLRIISVRSTQYTNIDIQTCIERNIALINAEKYWSDAPNYVLSKLFKSMTGILCGCREDRIV